MGHLTFGILSFPTAPYDDLAQCWRDVEALGFDGAWLADDLNLPGYSDFEIWTLLGALARDTGRLRLGTLVTSVTFRHPAFLAAQVITVDHLSRGRAEVALGAGADDMREDGNNYEVLTAPENFDTVRSALESAEVPTTVAEISMIPQNNVKLESKNAQTMLKLMESLEDHEDIQNVWANFDIDESELQEAS